MLNILVHRQSVQHPKGHRRLSSASFSSHNLSTVTPVTSAELRHIILESPPKSCELDPLPTSLLQEFVDVLLPLLTVLATAPYSMASYQRLKSDLFSSQLSSARNSIRTTRSTIDQSPTYRPSRNSLRRSSPSRCRRTLRLTIFSLVSSLDFGKVIPPRHCFSVFSPMCTRPLTLLK